MAGRSSTFALSVAATPDATLTPRLPCCAPRNETTLLCDLLHHSPILSDRNTCNNLCKALRRCFKPKWLRNRTHDLAVASIVLYTSSYRSQYSTHCSVRKTEDWNKLNTCGLSCVRPTDAFGRLFFCGITNTRWQKRSSTEKGVERLFFYLGFVLRFQMLHLLLVSLRNRFIIQPL